MDGAAGHLTSARVDGRRPSRRAKGAQRPCSAGAPAQAGGRQNRLGEERSVRLVRRSADRRGKALGGRAAGGRGGRQRGRCGGSQSPLEGVAEDAQRLQRGGNLPRRRVRGFATRSRDRSCRSRRLP